MFTVLFAKALRSMSQFKRPVHTTLVIITSSYYHWGYTPNTTNIPADWRGRFERRNAPLNSVPEMRLLCQKSPPLNACTLRVSNTILSYTAPLPLPVSNTDECPRTGCLPRPYNTRFRPSGSSTTCRSSLLRRRSLGSRQSSSNV